MATKEMGKLGNSRIDIFVMYIIFLGGKLMSSKFKVESISKEFFDDRTKESNLVINDLSFEVKEGEFLVIVGPSGCGKTTLLNILAGLEKSTSGSIKVDEQIVTGPGPERGVMFQEYALLPWKTVFDNVEFGLKHGAMSKDYSKSERKQRVQHFIELVGLKGSENKFVHQLSGGMKQRCALARLFANNHKILLMDEPLAATDAQTREVLQEELLNIWGQDRDSSKRKTVIYVTHAIDEAVFLGDRVIVLGQRPTTITEIVNIDIDRPRTITERHTEKYQQYQQEIWGLIKEAAVSATQK